MSIDNLVTIGCITLVVFVVLFIFLLIISCIIDIRDKKAAENEQEEGIYNDIKGVYWDNDKDLFDVLLADKGLDKCNNLLDDIIKMHITNYKILTGFTPESYITKETKDEMSLYVAEMVKKNMSSGVIYTIALFYNIENVEDLNNILDLRIKLNILADMIDQNAPIE